MTYTQKVLKVKDTGNYRVALNTEQQNPSHDRTRGDFGNRLQREGLPEGWETWTTEQRLDWLNS